MDSQENKDTGVKERRFKKVVNLRVRINSQGNGSSSAAPVATNVNKPSEPFSALEELLQCGICLERLSHPRMLPCQHTFCLGCLKTHVTAKSLRFGHANGFSLAHEIKTMSCPVCQSQVALAEGIASLDHLPRNLYLQSLLKVVEDSPTSPKVVENFRCVNCQTVSAQQEQVCQHCMQIFCSVCWSAHLAELEANLSVLLEQLDESEDRLNHKLENFVARCSALEEKIRKATMTKVESTLREEKRLLGEVISIKKEGGIASDILSDSILKLREDIRDRAKDRASNQKVVTYLNLHRDTSKILDQVGYFGEARITFDPDSFKLDQISEGIYNDDEDPHQNQVHAVANPFESVDSMARHYKSRSFTPKLVWNKCPRPAGLGIPPWDQTQLYIAATDSHNVLILDRGKFKLVERLIHPDMLCPAGLAFSAAHKQVFVSDKWKHCIHVFSSQGHYVKNISGLKLRSPDGIAMGPSGELIVCDTGNDRVLLIDPESGEKLGVIGAQNGTTQLNFPTSVAVYGLNIVVADSGNNRVKTYSLDGELLQQIGSFGRNPGQFRSVEVVAVDQLGFILVGDAGNARVQVFKPDGTLVKIFGSKSGFGWISGLLVTPNLEIIAADNKTRSLKIF